MVPSGIETIEGAVCVFGLAERPQTSISRKFAELAAMGWGHVGEAKGSPFPPTFKSNRSSTTEVNSVDSFFDFQFLMVIGGCGHRGKLAAVTEV